MTQKSTICGGHAVRVGSLTLLALLAIASIGSAGGTQKNVLILTGEDPLKPGTIAFVQNVRTALADGSTNHVEFFTETLDRSRFPEARYGAQRLEYFRWKYAERRPDLIIAAPLASLDFLIAHRDELFPGVPVVFSGADESLVRQRKLPAGFTGLPTRFDLPATLGLALQLQPGTREVVVVVGKAAFDKSWEDLARAAFRQFEPRIRFRYLSDLPMVAMMEELSRLPAHTVVIGLTVYRDAAGAEWSPLDIGREIARRANAPIYSPYEVAIGIGVVGGYVSHSQTNAQRVAGLGLRILNGEDASSIPVQEPTASFYTVDARAMQRWGLSEDRLPAGSQVRFRVPTFWEHYRWRIVAVVSLCALEAILILVLLVNRRRLRRTQGNLRQSEEWLSLATSSAKVGVWSRDVRTGKIEASQECRQIFGWRADEPMDHQKFIDRVHAEDRLMVQQAVDKAVNGRTIYDSQYRISLADGQVRWIAARGQCHYANGSPTDITGVVTDITERKRAEDQLKESEARFRMVADAAPVLIWMAGTDKLGTFFNKPWLDFTGRTLEQELGNGWVEGVHADDLQRCVKTYVEAFDARRPFEIQYRLRRHDGEHRWMLGSGVARYDADGDFSGYIGTCVDVTERRRAEEKFRLAVEASPNAIVMINQQDRIALVNTQAERMFRYGREELLGKDAGVLVPERHRGEEWARNAFFRRPQENGVNGHEELFARRKDGDEFPVEVRSNPFQSEEGTVVLCAIVDITDRRKTEQEMERHRQELAHVSRLAIMGELSASMAHELNQPLAAILCNTQAAQRFMAAGQPDLVEFREILKDIASDTTRARDVIRHLRTLVKKSEPDFIILDLGDTIREVVGFLHGDIVARNVRVKQQLAGDVPPIRGERIQLQQVLINLLLNAFDAMRSNPVSQRDATILAGLKTSRFVQVAVRDCGVGIPEEKLEAIFDPFYTTKSDGMGMGLSVSRSIVDAHGGRLWAESNGDRGTTLYFTLPVAEKP